MDNIKSIVYDGLKVTNLENVPEAWTPLTGQESDEVRQTVAWILRAEKLRISAVANMPFTIYRGKREVTTSQDYEDKLGFMPNPRRFITLVESALINYGRCYFWKGVNRAGITKELKYFVPSSIEPEIDAKRGLTEFVRRIASTEYKYKPEEILYFWPADGAVEIGPPTVWPYQSAKAAAKMLDAVNDFTGKFIERGLVKATLLGVPRSTQQSERDRVEEWFNRFIGGIKNAFRVKTINADDVQVNVIGEGLEGLAETTLTREAKEDIAAAYGIPFAIFFSDAANYATAQQDWRQWYDTSIIPECEFIASVINEQLLAPMGYTLEFQPETLDFYQEDEASRSMSLSNLTNAGVPLLTAMEILGFELTDEQRAAIEAEKIEKEKRAAEMAERMRQSQEQQPDQAEEDDEDEQPNPARGDMERWQRKALNALKRGKGAGVEFESTTIPMAWREDITAGLPGCEDAQAVRELFAPFVQTDAPVVIESDITALLVEMKRANDLLERSIDQPE